MHACEQRALVNCARSVLHVFSWEEWGRGEREAEKDITRARRCAYYMRAYMRGKVCIK